MKTISDVLKPFISDFDLDEPLTEWAAATLVFGRNAKLDTELLDKLYEILTKHKGEIK